MSPGSVLVVVGTAAGALVVVVGTTAGAFVELDADTAEVPDVDGAVVADAAT
jgi:hypothetical protein